MADNTFAQALKTRPASRPQAVEQPAASKHIGGYFDPAVAKQLRLLAASEDRTLTALLAEALDMLFQSRQLPTIAQKPARPPGA